MCPWRTCIASLVVASSIQLDVVSSLWSSERWRDFFHLLVADTIVIVALYIIVYTFCYFRIPPRTKADNELSLPWLDWGDSGRLGHQLRCCESAFRGYTHMCVAVTPIRRWLRYTTSGMPCRTSSTLLGPWAVGETGVGSDKFWLGQWPSVPNESKAATLMMFSESTCQRHSLVLYVLLTHVLRDKYRQK